LKLLPAVNPKELNGKKNDSEVAVEENRVVGGVSR
jgi:hypothetical protein